MRTMSLSTAFGLLAMSLVGISGCGKSKTSPPAAAPSAQRPDHGHVHGPHNGHVIELDTREYHAELTDDAESHRVSIYVLGADAKTAAPVEAASVTIAVSDDGQQTEFTLPAVAQPGETAGQSSYFELESEPLWTIVSGASDSLTTEAQLKITIDGTPHTGKIESANAHAAVHRHAPSAEDPLVWRKEFSELDYDVALGHHGTSLLAGDDVELAVRIVRDEQPVADAQVYYALLADDGQTVLAKEVAAVYEPATSGEPAHYAQATVKIPPGTRQATIRYRIVFPEGKGDRTFDVPVSVR